MTASDKIEAFSGLLKDFVAYRLRKKKVINESDLPSHEQIAEYIYDLSFRARHVFPATHISKCIHPSSRSRNIRLDRKTAIHHGFVGTSEILKSKDVTIDVAAGAVNQDVAAFLSLEIDGKLLADLISEGDEDIYYVLGLYVQEVDLVMGRLSSIDDRPPSPFDKQIFWMNGNDACSDQDYVVLQPVFPSTLLHYLHAQIKNANSKENGQARSARRDKEPCDTSFIMFPGLALRQIGGTKPHNISYLNAKRFGENFLLPSLPPKWSSTKKTFSLMKSESGVTAFISRYDRKLSKLADLLQKTPPFTMFDRRMKERIEHSLIAGFIQFSAEIRSTHPEGWTKRKDHSIQMHECEKLWFDPPRDAKISSTKEWLQVVEFIAKRLSEHVVQYVVGYGASNVGKSDQDHFEKLARRCLLLSSTGVSAL